MFPVGCERVKPHEPEDNIHICTVKIITVRIASLSYGGLNCFLKIIQFFRRLFSFDHNFPLEIGIFKPFDSSP